jgi:Lrp/AsnC family transcriptional regulator, regulator for asnA, asnC and gidA
MESLIRIIGTIMKALPLEKVARLEQETVLEAVDSSELDDTDRGILRRLQKDARASFKKIADEIGVSEATVFVRVKKLQEKGAIRGFFAIVDAKVVGKSLTAIILVRAMPRNFLGMLDGLKKIDDVYEIYDVTGQYSSIIKVRAANTDELSKVIDRIGMVEGVAGTETIIVLRTVKEDPGVKI